jgi:hypothetical protein
MQLRAARSPIINPAAAADHAAQRQRRGSMQPHAAKPLNPDELADDQIRRRIDIAAATMMMMMQIVPSTAA